MEDIFAGSLMTTDIETIEKSATLKQVCERLESEGINSLLIVNENNQLEGIVTATDVVSCVSYGDDLESTKVEDVMTTDVFTVSADTHLQDVANTMMSKKIHHIPVEEKGEVFGILSTTDIAAYISSVIAPSPE